MTDLDVSNVPLAVRVRNDRYDGMVTGWLHGGVSFQKGDPGGFKSASFKLDQRLGYRSDIVQDYSRVYIYNKRNGDTVFEGDVSHPGRSVSSDGAVLEVQVEMDRLNDWSGSRIYCDRDMQAWTKTSTAATSSSVEVGDDRGASGVDALVLAFGDSIHVETTARAEAGYFRILEAGQTLGWLNYAWDAGLTNASWVIRSIVTPPSTVARSQTANVAGSGGSGAVVGGAIPIGATVAYLQFMWNSGPSNTGNGDTTWVSYLRPVVIPRLHLKDGTFKTSGYGDTVTAVQVWEDMLGDMLADSFDGTFARVDAGTGQTIAHLVYPDGVTPQQIADDLMTFEPGCTYIIGPSTPLNDKYSLSWISRPNSVRYESLIWVDEHTGGIQPVEQFDEVMSRWKTPQGNIRMTLATQSIPEMAAVNRHRRYFQDLGTQLSDGDNVTVANATVLQEHRYPKNTGRLRISRTIVDLFTGRRVEPFEIEPGYMIRLVGIDPNLDAINASMPNGSTVCRIVNTDYSGDDHAVDLDLDAVPYSMARAIRNARPRPLPTPLYRRVTAALGR